MKDLNRVVLMGRLGGDPVQKTSASGVNRVQFSVATSRRVRGEAPDQWVDQTQWHSIIAWGKLGDICHQYLKKGLPVYLEGSLKSRKFEDSKGQLRTLHEVHLDEVHLLSRSEPVLREEAKSA